MVLISVWDVVGVSVGRPFGGGLFDMEERTEGRKQGERFWAHTIRLGESRVLGGDK